MTATKPFVLKRFAALTEVILVINVKPKFEIASSELGFIFSKGQTGLILKQKAS